MGDKSATVTAEAAFAARPPSAGLADARSASPGAEPPDPQVTAPDAARPPSAGLADARSASPEGEPPDPQATPRPSLSPSRAGDFLTCPLLYRYRVIDRL